MMKALITRNSLAEPFFLDRYAIEQLHILHPRSISTSGLIVLIRHFRLGGLNVVAATSRFGVTYHPALSLDKGIMS